ncbi:hypothetical protein [Algicola sagamiensis]|uniref:hypothetical protein n=1 Tax=Algicola sagamiensis TaxID=163869 RepID=UPI000382299D|nr:hypothetical protein [Algicola sagamiensis]
MSANLPIVDNDMVTFLPVFGKAIAVVPPGQIKASGTMTIMGKKVCIEGDEKSVKVSNCMYMAPPFVVPGMGEVTIKLKPNNLTKKGLHKKKLILKGSMFDATFKVTSPAKQPPPPAGSGAPDPSPQYKGQAQFVPSQFICTSK